MTKVTKPTRAPAKRETSTAGGTAKPASKSGQFVIRDGTTGRLNSGTTATIATGEAFPTPTTEAGASILRGIEQAAAIARGDAVDGAVIHHPPPAGDVDIKALRKRLKLSQQAFADRFGLSVGAVRDWEQGRRTPEPAARVLLRVIDREPEAVSRALADT